MEDEILTAIKPLLATYRKSFTSVEDRDMAMKAYTLGLSSIPPVYIAAAVVKFLRGGVERWNPSDMPSVEELAKVANKFWQCDLDLTNSQRETEKQLSRLPPEPLSLEEQAKRRAFVERAIKQMPPITNPDGRVPLTDLPKDQAQDGLDAMAANKNRAIPVSNELFEKLTGGTLT